MCVCVCVCVCARARTVLLSPRQSVLKTESVLLWACSSVSCLRYDSIEKDWVTVSCVCSFSCDDWYGLMSK